VHEVFFLGFGINFSSNPECRSSARSQRVLEREAWVIAAVHVARNFTVEKNLSHNEGFSLLLWPDERTGQNCPLFDDKLTSE
jgi:hypothetical protein